MVARGQVRRQTSLYMIYHIASYPRLEFLWKARHTRILGTKRLQAIAGECGTNLLRCGFFLPLAVFTLCRVPFALVALLQRVERLRLS